MRFATDARYLGNLSRLRATRFTNEAALITAPYLKLNFVQHKAMVADPISGIS